MNSKEHHPFIENEQRRLLDAERRLRNQNRILLQLAKSEALGRGDLDSALQQITEVAARTLETERVSVWLYDESRTKLCCVELFERLPERHSKGSELAAAQYPSYFSALEEERIVAAHDAHHDQRTSEFSQDYLSPLGISSMLDAPVRLGSRMVGVVCHEHVGNPRHWSIEEQNFAGSLADLVSLAVAARERRQAEEDVRRSEIHFRSLIENALDIIAVLDAEGVMRYISPSVRKVLGYDPEQIIGKLSFDFIHPDDSSRLMNVHRQLVQQPDGTASVEMRVKHADGSWRYLESIGHNLLDNDAVAGVVINFRDITERKQAEQLLADYSRELERKVEERTRELQEKNQELHKTLEQLRAAQNQLVLREKLASLGSLVAGIAHEINTPIGAVNSAADLSDRCVNKIMTLFENAPTLDALRSDEQFQNLLSLLKDNTHVTATAVERISNILRSLKNFARLDEAELQKADIHEGLESTLTLVHHEVTNKAEVIRKYGQLPRILCYPNQLNQVFMNLFMNAAQAIEMRGTITIRTWTDESNVYVAIADTGRGISQENLYRIFDPGFTTKGVGVGTGLGLSISYSIVRKHNGDIRVESEPGKGTEFTIVLPKQPGGLATEGPTPRP